MNLQAIAHRYSAVIRACVFLAPSLLIAATPLFAQDKSEFVIRDVRILTERMWFQAVRCG